MRAFLIALVLAAVLSACTSPSLSITAPSGSKCNPTISSPAPAAFPASGGNGSITVATTDDCAWTASTDAGWVTLSRTTGQGEASVSYTVAANPAHTARASAIAVGGSQIPVAQAAALCRVGLSRTSEVVPAAGGTLTIDVETLAGCGWNASSSVAWIAVTAGGNGSGNGTVTLVVAANSNAARSGHVTIADQTFTVDQRAPASPGAPPPAAQPPPPAEPPPVTAPPPEQPPPTSGGGGKGDQGGGGYAHGGDGGGHGGHGD